MSNKVWAMCLLGIVLLCISAVSFWVGGICYLTFSTTHGIRILAIGTACFIGGGLCLIFRRLI